MNQQPTLNLNKIEQVIFQHQFKMNVLQSIKTEGIERTKAKLLAEGLSDAKVRAIIRNIIRRYGW